MRRYEDPLRHCLPRQAVATTPRLGLDEGLSLTVVSYRQDLALERAGIQ